MSFLKSKIVHGVGGLLLMGSWAAFANRAHPMPAPVIAGIIQGLITAAITLFLKNVVERIFWRTDGWKRLIAPPFAAFLVSLTLLTAIHTIARTPSLLTTISVPLSVSTLYALLYTLTMSRHV
ncbi:MAG: hypothetical protein ABJ360_04125 [Roseobacter sp.]